MKIIPHNFRHARDIVASKGLHDEVDTIIKELHRGWLKKKTGLLAFQKEILNKYRWTPEYSIGIENRRYAYDGFKEGLAFEIEWNVSEKILEVILKMQFGFVTGQVEAGLIVNVRSDAKNSPIPPEEAGGAKEIEEMKCIITVPLYLVVFGKD